MIPRVRVRWSWLWAVNALVLIFLAAPMVVVIYASFSQSAIITLPLRGVSLRWYQEVLASHEFLGPLAFSIQLGLAASVLAILLGVPAAFALVRYRFPGRHALNAFFLSPLMIPTVVIGLGLLLFASSLRLFGSVLILLIGHAVIVVPYVIRSTAASLYRFDRTLEEAAQSLGRGVLGTFWHVTLPVIRPGIIAGTTLAFITSFDELALTLFLVSPQQITLPIRVYSYVEFRNDPAIAAISTIMIVLTLLAVFTVDRVQEPAHGQ